MKLEAFNKKSEQENERKKKMEDERRKKHEELKKYVALVGQRCV